jgi:hypothetical protein
MKPISKDQFVGIMLKVDFASDIYRTMGVLEITNNKLKNRSFLINNLLFKLDQSKNNYKALEVKDLYLSYRLYEEVEVSAINPSLLRPQINKKNVNYTIENKNSLPNTMDL